MRNADGTLNGDLNDNTFALTSGSLRSIVTASINENDTVYDLMPVAINQPPIIVRSISEASSPIIQTVTAQQKRGDKLYKAADGTIKVLIGTSFTLSVVAEQPKVYNVENGVPVIKNSKEELTYVWRFYYELISSMDLPTLQSNIQVSNQTIKINNIQPQFAGAFYCEVSNDVGTTISEVINIEVLNPDVDSFFYTNLIENGDGSDGTSNWNASGTEFVVKGFSNLTSTELSTTNRVDLFGYTVDTMHPRPYQLNTDSIKGTGYSNFLKGGSYFSRSEYLFEKAGGNFYVKAYQDIDVTDLRDIIQGGVFGLEGVRAVFGCYIGNAISKYIPVKELVLPSELTKEKNDSTGDANYVMRQPRISFQNYMVAGPGFVVDKAFVTIEEYDNETKLLSSVLFPDGTSTDPKWTILEDPWSKRLGKYTGQRYYTGSFGTPITDLTSNSDDYWKKISEGLSTREPDDVDKHLFVADELQPPRERFTHGQYLEFNKIIIDKLNPKTTKIRITLNFYTNDWRMFDVGDSKQNDAIFENIGWQNAYIRNTLEDSKDGNDNIIYTISRDPRFADLPVTERRALAPSPRVAITGLTLSLIPIQNQNKGVTDYYTSSSLTLNDRQASTVAKGLKRR
jgi:hypothetical protein